MPVTPMESDLLMPSLRLMLPTLVLDTLLLMKGLNTVLLTLLGLYHPFLSNFLELDAGRDEKCVF